MYKLQCDMQVPTNGRHILLIQAVIWATKHMGLDLLQCTYMRTMVKCEREEMGMPKMRTEILKKLW